MDKKVILKLTSLCLSYFVAFVSTIFLRSLSGINLFIPFLSVFIVSYIVLIFVLKIYFRIKKYEVSKSIFYCSLGLLLLSIYGTIFLLFIPAYTTTLDYHILGYIIAIFICLVTNIIIDILEIKKIGFLHIILSNLLIYLFIFIFNSLLSYILGIIYFIMSWG